MGEIESKKEGSNTDTSKTLYCSFCGKSEHEVDKLVAGPSVFICNDCVDLCNEIIKKDLKSNLSENNCSRWKLKLLVKLRRLKTVIEQEYVLWALLFSILFIEIIQLIIII